MTIMVNLIGDGRMVTVDDRTATLGGSFYYFPLRPYSPLPLKWCYDQLARYSESVLVDVGASTGSFALLAALHPGLTVHAIEPVELTYKVLKENVYLNGLQDRVHCYRAGISDYNGTGVLHTIKADGGKGVSIVDGVPSFHKDVVDTPISVMTLDRLCDTLDIVPTFLKIDIEGNEKAALRGAEKTITQNHPFILCEYSSENADQFEGNVSDIITMLESWGYVWQNPEGCDIWATHLEWEKIGKYQVIEKDKTE